ncbi:serine hydrolase [Chryseobacterium sp. ON_d1]|uniref:serine hydrolase n=1 Tax=Chryseobacterium sp. ON_d1 TaxID=2583211 RepID=UPI00115A3A6F|nr:serine hydrolase [Chryseobacterium sp. ON_d1]GEJ43666.1 penicillin-binding protein 4* [Chryseobacterium sp. ON_d1]
MKVLNINFYWIKFFTAVLIWKAVSFPAQNKLSKIDDYFSAYARHGDFNGIILIAEKSKIFYKKAFGFSDFENKIPNALNTRFPIASIGKLLTATAALQLVEKGLLKLDNPVQEYLPDFPYQDVTLLHLLSHTSGLPSWDVVFKKKIQEVPKAVFRNNDLLKEYSKANIPLSFTPGSAHEYNNVNSAFVALLIEKASGIPYETYMKQNIFIPSGMKDAFIPEIPFYNYTPSEQKNMAKLYVDHMYTSLKESVDSMRSNRDYWRRFNFKGFGEFVMTAEDLFRFNNALAAGKLLSLSMLERAQTAIQLNNGTPLRIGLGWQVEQDHILGKTVGHTGGITGLSTGFIYQPDTKRLVIVFDNTQQNVEELENDALMLMMEQRLIPPRENIARIYGPILLQKGPEAADNKLNELKQIPVRYQLSEQQFNKLGYDFLRSGKMSQAIETFRINTELFPQSYNTFDSYGEALLKDNQKEKALIMYRKSVELNPEHEKGKNIIRELEK